MDISQELTESIQELQLLERNLQSYVMEKQNLQVELNEINNALDEIKNSSDEVYKIMGGLMIRASKDVLSKDLVERKNALSLKINSIEKQESSLEEKAEKLRTELNEKITAQSGKQK